MKSRRPKNLGPEYKAVIASFKLGERVDDETALEGVLYSDSDNGNNVDDDGETVVFKTLNPPFLVESLII